MTITAGAEKESIWRVASENISAQLLFESQYKFLWTAWKCYCIVANLMCFEYLFPTATQFTPKVESTAIKIYCVWGKNKNKQLRMSLYLQMAGKS